MRFTLEHVGDLEVPDGVTLAECRPGLVALAGAGLAAAPLTVDGWGLGPDHVAGAEPWVVGCTVRVGPGSQDPVARAARAPWHVAVVSGPDAGAVAVPDQRGLLRIGRGSGPAATPAVSPADGPTMGLRAGPDGPDGRDRPDRIPGHLLLTDPAVSRAHVTLHASRGAGPTRWRVRDAGSANGTRLVRRRGHRTGAAAGAGDAGGATVGARAAARSGAGRRLPRLPLSLRVGDLLTVGGTVLELRRHPGVVEPAPGPALDDRSATPHRRALPASAWVVPLVGAVLLLAITRSPIALVLSLGAIAPALPGVLAAVRRRRSAAAGPVVLAEDPAAVAIRLAGGRVPARPTAGPRLVAGRVAPVDGPAPQPPWSELALEGLAVIGPRPAALAVVHGLLGAALAADTLALTVLHLPDRDADWAWCRWLEGTPGSGWPRVARDVGRVTATLAAPPRQPPGGPPGAPGGALAHLVLDDHGDPWRTALHRWWSTGRGPRDGALLVGACADEVPAWCRWVLRIGPGDATLLGPGGPRVVEVPSPRAGWIEEQARRVGARAAADARGVEDAPALLPRIVGLGDLGLPDDVASIRRCWGLGATGAPPRTARLVARIGIGTRTPGAAPRGAPAPVDVDLLADGPHTLVAGTTGSGKSELLQALVLSLALRHPPAELALVLIDFKGGAGLGPCRDLPHVVGEVTDLDPVEAGRALEGLRAELRRRERLLAAHGVADLEELRARWPAPPRLVVVVDELRALAEDLPDFVPRLVRVAAQGRSLGIHLVLATQRPAGVVDAQLRANVAIRVCLRVADPADSSDVVDAPDAAAIATDQPGRALLRCGPGSLRTVQTAWPALRPANGDPSRSEADGGPGPGRDVERNGQGPQGHAPGAVAHGPGARGIVRRAVPWHRGDEADEHPPRTGHAEHLVAAVRAAGQGLDLPTRLWRPPLPPTLALADLPTVAISAGPPGEPSGPQSGPPPGLPFGLPFGLVDRPERQEQGPLVWDPRSGPLLVAGGPRSGRTSALRTLAVAALGRGWHVHAVLGRPDPDLLAATVDHAGLGTVVGVDDPRRVARLLTLLAASPTPDRTDAAPRLLLVDDADTVRGALARLPRGAPLDLLEQTVRAGTRPDLAVAVSGAPSDLVRLLPLAGLRLVLAVADPHDDALLGVPRSLAAGRTVPGRGVVVGAMTARCQVATTEGQPRPAGASAGPPGARAPLRLAALPLDARRTPATGRVAHDPPGARRAPLLGPGGDDGAPVTVGLDAGLLVVGPSGSGRSAALAALAAQLPGGSLLAARGTGTDPGALLAGLGGARPGTVLVVDDLDLLVRAHPGLDEQLAAWVVRAETDPSVPRVVAAARTDRAAAAYRGVIAALRSCAPVLVLAPHTAGSTDVAGCDLWHVTDPAWPDHPGRGALVRGGRATPVQLAMLPAATAPLAVPPAHRAPAAPALVRTAPISPPPGGGLAPA